MDEALDKHGNIIKANSVTERESEYRCKDCHQKMLFVDADLKIKHFRHLEKCECESEPETPIHVYHKKAVYEELCKMNIGQVFLEYSIDNNIIRPDVLVKRVNAPDIAIEVQATNMDLSLFEKKIEYYKSHGYITVYLFVQSERTIGWNKRGDTVFEYTTDFLQYKRKNVFRLKEIEQRLCYSRHYGSSVRGLYLYDHRIYYYDLEPKSVKGGEGYCSSTFRTNWENNLNATIQDFLNSFALQWLSLQNAPIRQLSPSFIQTTKL